MSRPLMPARARLAVYVGAAVLGVVLLVLAVVAPDAWQRAREAIPAIVTIITSLLAALHVSGTEAEQDDSSPTGAVAGPASDVPDGEPVEVVPADVPAADTKADATYHEGLGE